MADYLGYANSLNRMGNPIAEGLNQIGDTIQQNRLMSLREATANREMALREAAAAREAESSGIQNRLSLANLNDVEAQQQGRMSAAGVKTLPEYWQKKAEAEKLQLQQEESQKRATNIVENYNKIDAMVKAGRIKPETAKEFYSAVMAEQGIDLTEKGMDVDFTPTHNYYSGPITKDAVFMVNGQPVPFNGNGTISKARIVGMQGVKPIFEMGADTVFTESKPDQMDLLLKRDELQSQRDEKNRRAADARLERTLSAKGQAPQPGKVLPAGQLESLSDAAQIIKTLEEAQGIAPKVNTGAVMGRVQSLGQYIGAAGEDFNQFKQKIATANNIMLKLRSGAAVTESEYNRFLQEMPTPNDDEKIRDTKLQNAINYARDLLTNKTETFREGGYKVPGGVVDRSKASAGGKPPAKGKKPLSAY